MLLTWIYTFLRLHCIFLHILNVLTMHLCCIEGIYLLEVLTVDALFSQCKLKVDEGGLVTVVEYKYPGGMYPVKLIRTIY
jgi:hypothetical protein